MRITFYRSKCIGCNYCVEVWPERWQISRRDAKCVLVGGKKKGNVYRADVGEHERLENELAASVCPVDVIRIDE